MVIELIAAVVVGLIVLAAFFEVAEFLWNKFGPSKEHETRTTEETRRLTHEFIRKKATVTFPNGNEERVTYDERIDDDGRIELVTLSPECWTVGRSFNSGRPTMDRVNAPSENTRTFSLSNIRDIDVERTEEMVAAIEVPIEKKQERLGDTAWSTERVRFDYHEDYDCQIWYKNEWEAHVEGED